MEITELQQRLIDLFEPAVSAEGLELYHIEVVGQPGRMVLRVYLEKPGGVTLDDCSAMSRSLSALLDVEDPITGRYTLEVSSPGINRLLVKPAHFESAVGETVKVKTVQPLQDKRRNFDGTLTRVDLAAEIAVVETEHGEVDIPFDRIAKAHINREIEMPKKRRRKGKA